MIPMRDGVRLQTVLLTPKNAKGPLPFLIDRTPYGVPGKEATEKGLPAGQRWRSENYIFVSQNIRGRFQSEGKFVMFRPPHDPKDAKGVDETTDAWDTVEWLVKNVPNNNGRAGIAGTSYDGWTAVMAALNPHPALQAAIEQASPADQFLGDDFHHNGAFRLSYGFEYSAMLETSATENYRFQFDRADTYDWYLGLGALANADEKYFHGKVPTWTDFTRHPNYDAFWQRQAFAPYLNAVKLPILHVAGWWDQEDFYGPQKIYELMERHDTEQRNYFVAGPWNHGGWNGNGTQTGRDRFRQRYGGALPGEDFSAVVRSLAARRRARGNWPRRRCSRRGRTSGRSMIRGRRSAGWRRGGCISARAGGWRSTGRAGAGSMSM